MSMQLIRDLPERGNLMIVTSHCGTGHLQVTNYLEKELKAHRAALNVLTVDVIKNTIGDYFGNLAIEDWNAKARAGGIEAINNALNYQWVDVWAVSVFTFFSFLFALLKNDTHIVITNQPLALPSLIRAARVVNFLRQFFASEAPPIKVRLVLTELPTKDASLFFYEIKYLTEADREIFQLVASKPLLEKGETEEGFWKTHCDLSLAKGEVVYDTLPVRHAFHRVAGQERASFSTLDVQIAKPEEAALLRARLGNRAERLREVPSAGDDQLPLQQIPVQPEDEVGFLMLGGQASVQATKDYVEAVMTDAVQHPPVNKDRYLFVFCGKDDPTQPEAQSLYRQVHALAARVDQASRLKIIPLTQQSDEQVAPMLARSNFSITKSGGVTSMELQTAAKGRIFLHSAYQGENADQATLIDKGMYLWEGGNARHLQRNKGATIVTPATFATAFHISL